MSNISNISSSTTSLTAITAAARNVGATAEVGSSTDAGDAAGAQGGYVIEAITKTLSLSFTSGDSNPDPSSRAGTSADETTGDDPTPALGSFIQSLLTALQDQGDADDDSSNAASDVNSSVSASSNRAPLTSQLDAGGPGKFETDLQNLISELRNPDNTDHAELETSFNNLLSTLGDTDSGTTLSDFLSNLQSHLQSGATPVGGVIDTRA